MLAGTIGGGLGGASGLIGDPLLNMIARGVTGGVTSSLRGGDFKMGFAIGLGTAAAFHAYTAVTGFSGIRPGPGGDVVARNSTGPAAIEGANSVGFTNETAAAVQAAKDSLCCYEGSWLMSAAGMVPGVNAMAGFHDFLTGPNYLGMNLFTNVPTMLPSYGLTLAGGINQLTINESTVSLTAPLLTQIGIR